MIGTIKSGIVEQCRVLAISGTGDVVCQTPTRHTRVGLEGARAIVNWQAGWLRGKYSELATTKDVTYKLQWFFGGEWTDHEKFRLTDKNPQGLRKVSRELIKGQIRIPEIQPNMEAKFAELLKASRSATKDRISASPRIPDWIREFPRDEEIAGWTNKFRLMPQDPNIYSESLRPDWKLQFDDWKGKILLLSKDPCPTEKVREMLDKRVSFLHRAQRELADRSGFGTNTKMYSFASIIPGGKLFGSAAANMLCDRTGYSRELGPEVYAGPLHDYLKRALCWVVEAMSRGVDSLSRQGGMDLDLLGDGRFFGRSSIWEVPGRV